MVSSNSSLSSVIADALYSPAEVGQRIQFHEESVRRAVREGRIKAVYIGRKIRIRGDVLLRIMSVGLPVTTPQPVCGGQAR